LQHANITPGEVVASHIAVATTGMQRFESHSSGVLICLIFLGRSLVKLTQRAGNRAPHYTVCGDANSSNANCLWFNYALFN